MVTPNVGQGVTPWAFGGGSMLNTDNEIVSLILLNASHGMRSSVLLSLQSVSCLIAKILGDKLRPRRCFLARMHQGAQRKGCYQHSPGVTLWRPPWNTLDSRNLSQKGRNFPTSFLLQLEPKEHPRALGGGTCIKGILSPESCVPE